MSFHAKLIALGSVFVALLAALVLGALISPRAAAQRAETALVFPGLNTDRVQAVELSDSASRLRLTRDAGWSLEAGGKPFPATIDKVTGLLKQVASLSRGTVVTRDPKAADALGLAAKDAKKIVLRGQGGTALCELTVGKPAAGGGYYLRAGDRPEVLQTGEGLATYLAVDRPSWADLRVLPRDVKTDSLMRISVASSLPKPGEKPGVRMEYTLMKEKGSAGALAWSFSPAAGAGVDQQKAGQLAGAIVALEGADVLTDLALGAAALATPAATVTVSLTDNRTFTIVLGPATPARQYPCSLREGGPAFLVPEWRLEGILPSQESLAAR
jgi:hypothetical protein